jgi:hypothetical protein
VTPGIRQRAYRDNDVTIVTDVDSGRSTSGYLLCIGTGAVSWSSKLQLIVALSTTEAEFVAAVEAGKEMV